ncbi:MAG: hypothetical protein ACKVLJ_02515, partial [Cytophagales bacterium]
LRTSQEALQEEKVQILCRCVSVDSTGHVFTDMKFRNTLTQVGMRRKRAAPLMNLSVRLVGLKKAPRITISLGAHKYLKIFSICKYE